MKKGLELLKPLENMYFIDIKELYNNIEYIKSQYNQLSLEYKTIYKWYFFQQLCLIREFKINPIKTIMWEYINECCDRSMVDISYQEWCNFQVKIEKNNE
jgi:hypothetical protein